MSRSSDRPHRSSLAPQVRLLGLALVALALGAAWWRTSPAGGPAPGSADEDVRVVAGAIHTVRHSLRPLPSADAPRADGLPTLVEFSATWCEICHRMAPVMERVRRDTAGRLVVVEKDIESDMALARSFRVRGTPTFVLLDARGREIGRPPPDFDAGQFVANLERLVARAGG